MCVCVCVWLSAYESGVEVCINSKRDNTTQIQQKAAMIGMFYDCHGYRGSCKWDPYDRNAKAISNHSFMNMLLIAIYVEAPAH